MDYLSRYKQEVQHFTVHPQGLVTRGPISYVLATINQHDDIRQLALHRFQTVQSSSVAYRSRPEFNVQDYITEGSFGLPVTAEPVVLVAQLNSHVAWKLRETPVSDDQTLSEPDADGWIELRATVPNDQQTLWWIHGFGAGFHVVQPAEWRDHQAEQAEKILSQAKKKRLPAFAAGGNAMSYERLKQRQRAERHTHNENLALRTHRSLSWLNRAEQAEDLDGQFIFLWIAFNAAYATEIDERLRLREQENFKVFLNKLCELDQQNTLEKLVWQAFPATYGCCWTTVCVSKLLGLSDGKLSHEDWQQRFIAGKQRAKIASAPVTGSCRDKGKLGHSGSILLI
ncbi:WYL domain-containing protein [Halopseudomonas pachastrellae]|nr:WYL domain-containing protein [Halopseudomonas pachastrellae]